jgi:hypothetical protein
MPNKPKIVWSICQNCKKPFRVEQKELRRGNGLYCGRRCASSVKSWAHMSKRNNYGPNNYAWKGGRTLHAKGYIYAYAPDHPRASNGYVFEHILVAEKKLGRYLLPGETPHHKNFIKDDNRPENIEILSAKDHGRLHVQKMTRDARGRFLGSYNRQRQLALVLK